MRCDCAGRFELEKYSGSSQFERGLAQQWRLNAPA